MTEPLAPAVHTDLAGNQIYIGSHIVYAALWDRSAVLKYGIVSSLKDREDYHRRDGNYTKYMRPTLGVITADRTWDDRWELQNKGKEITLSFTDRCLVVEIDSVPEGARDLLFIEYAKRLSKGKKK